MGIIDHRDKGTALSKVEREPVEPMDHLREATLDPGSARGLGSNHIRRQGRRAAQQSSSLPRALA